MAHIPASLGFPHVPLVWDCAACDAHFSQPGLMLQEQYHLWQLSRHHIQHGFWSWHYVWQSPGPMGAGVTSYHTSQSGHHILHMSQALHLGPVWQCVGELRYTGSSRTPYL